MPLMKTCASLLTIAILLLNGCATSQPTTPSQALVVTPADLEAAIMAGDVPRLREHLKAAPALLHHRLQDGGTWLHLGAAENKLQICRALFAAGIDLAAADNTGHTALHRAATQGHASIVEFLAVAYPPALEHRCQNGMTPFLEAVHQGHTHAVRSCIAAGANLLVRNSSHQNALDIANAQHRPELLRELRPQLLQAFDHNLHRRTPVAVFDFTNRARPEDAHWGSAISGLLSRGLTETGLFRVLEDNSIVHVRQSQQLADPLSPLTPAQYKELGRTLLAARFISGEFRREGPEWVVSLEVIDAATGETFLRHVAKSADWFLIRDQLLAQIFTHEKLQLSPPQWDRVRQRPVNSLAALEKFSLLVHGLQTDTDFLALEAHAREALAAEPESAQLMAALATVLLNQGRLYDARKVAEGALAQDPRNSRILHLLGSLEIIQENPAAALPFLLRSVDSDSDHVNSHMRLSEALLFSGHPELALFYCEAAVRLDPHWPTHRARLASVHHQLGNKAEASAQLRELERLGLPDPGELNVVGYAYAQTGDFFRAAQALERFVEHARSLSLNPPLVDAVAEFLQALRPRLVPAPVQAVPPADPRKLHDLLSPEELALTEDPLASSPEIAQWAKQLSLGAEDSLATAKAIFDALAHPFPQTGQGGSRTARQVFASFNDKSQVFNCQELSKLYVVLAREAGLHVFYVHLDRDYAGNYVLHDCAIVFTERGAFLVDPAYRWFGVPHQQFTPLSDLEAMGHHLLQKHGPDALPLNRVGLKLQGSDPWAHVQFGRRLADLGHTREATEILEAVTAKAPDRWDVAQLAGWIDYSEGDFDSALAHLTKALQENPMDGGSCLLLADIYKRKGLLLQAADQLRAALRTPLDPAQKIATEEELARLLTSFSSRTP